MKNILEYLEASAEKYPSKTAFIEEKNSITYTQLLQKCECIGTAIIEKKIHKKPILIYIEKSIACIEAMFGVVYSGNFYSVLDVNSPEDRLSSIINTLSPAAVVTTHSEVLPDCFNDIDKIFVEDCNISDREKLDHIRSLVFDTEPLYVLFTSGSTGVPKGAVVTHRNVISYTEWVCKTFDITCDTVFGSQAPFYFSMSVTDVFSSLASGATFVILPKYLFMFPVKLLEFMEQYRVNTIYWVPSALSIVANVRALDVATVSTLRKIMFAGESMPVKQLNVWRKHFPDAMFANLFGPTETTDICTYYIVDREFNNDESLPIGRHCDNCDILVLNDDGTQTAYGDEGELCVRGSFVIPGYYNNSEKTASVFVQNPLNKSYPEIIYKTGDKVKYNENGELIYLGRKDFQIKHMGYRIELGEIESAAYSTDGIREVCCVYDNEKSKIVLVYDGEISADIVENSIKSKVPEYMIPEILFKIDSMPHNANGKIDRNYIKTNYRQMRKAMKEKNNA